MFDSLLVRLAIVFLVAAGFLMSIGFFQVGNTENGTATLIGSIIMSIAGLGLFLLF